jgi:hypothetical protein
VCNLYLDLNIVVEPYTEHGIIPKIPAARFSSHGLDGASRLQMRVATEVPRGLYHIVQLRDQLGSFSPGLDNSKTNVYDFDIGLMIVSGYYEELVVTGDLTPRWLFRFNSILFFSYIVYELLVGLAEASKSETDPIVQKKIQTAQLMKVISLCTYPVVRLFTMLGINAATAIALTLFGYCASVNFPNTASDF